jgi:CheY-like chemotaxis protein
MPTKVLVFESDPAFAGELRTELGRLGLVAHVVDDGNAGLMAAASDRPDLILLSIELPRMNGFSVCNKLKKDPALKDVPLIIMSSESSDDTFEQHRKLRTRAEDYVHKPIAFGELLEHMRPYVELENGSGPISLGDDAAIIIDDEIELNDVVEESNGATEGGSAAPASGRVDEEVEAFADSAFNRLMDSQAPPPPQSTPPEAKALSSVLPPAPAVPVPVVIKKSSIPPRPTFDAEVERLRSELERQKTEGARLERELQSAKTEIQRLEEAALADPGSNDQIVRLQRELDELRSKAASGGKVGGVSSREFLDLREALNKKDKEILGLRDQISRKEKDLLDANDTALALERQKADLEDKIGSLEKDVQSAKALADTAKADKEQAAKRAEDFKSRGEKTKIELESKLAELSTIHKKHEGELAERDVQHAAVRDQLQQELAAAKEQHQQEMEREAEGKRSALEAAQKAAEEKLNQSVHEVREAEQKAREEAIAQLKAEAESDRSSAVAAREAELTKEHDLRLAGLYRTNEEEQNRLKGELSKAVEDAESARARLGEREKELDQEKSNALEGQRKELEASFEAEKGELTEKHTKERDELTEKHTKEREAIEARAADLAADLSTRTEEREVLAREVSDLKGKLGPLESELAELKTDFASTKEKLTAQTQKLDTAISKWAANRASFEQAKDAIAAAVAQIEEAEQRGLE